MKNIHTHIEIIRRYVINAKTSRALEELGSLSSTYFDKERKNDIMTLHSEYNRLKREEELGFGYYNKELNRINATILSILDGFEIQIPKEDTREKSEVEERFELLEKNIEIILDLQYSQLNGYYSSFKRSKLWFDLEEKSKEAFDSIAIAEREDNLDNYSFIMEELKNILILEFQVKLFVPFREYKKDLIPDEATTAKTFRREFMNSLKGNQKKYLFDFLVKEDETLSFKQMLEIIYDNILIISGKKEKDSLRGWGKFLYYFFHDNFKIKDTEKTIIAFEELAKMKNINSLDYYVYTDYEAGIFKNRVLDILTNIQIKKSYLFKLRSQGSDE